MSDQTKPAAAGDALRAAATTPEKRPPGRPRKDGQHPKPQIVLPDGRKKRAAPEPVNGSGPGAPAPAQGAPGTFRAAIETAAPKDAQKAAPKPLPDILTGPTAPRLCADLYGIPFEIFAAYAGEPALMLDEERLTRGGRALVEVLRAYGGDWLRHLPLIMLAASLGGDALHVAKRYRELQKQKQDAEPKPVVRPADPPNPAAMKGGAS